MKGIYTLLFSLIVLVMFSACNDEWKEEQFEHYISFKAPINSNGVTRINLSYSETGKTTYRLPILVSGSTKNDRDITVKIGIDADTLRTLNIARFSSREDLWYREMPSKHYPFPETVQIKAGENVGYLDIEFDLTGLDLVDKWVLPLTIEDAPNGEYKPNYRKHYRKALLRVMPFNDYSGTYGGTNLQGKLVDAGAGENEPLVKSEIVTYAIDDETIFFYAGTIDESRQDRRNYKIIAHFVPNTNIVELTSDNSENNGFKINTRASSYIEEEMDAVRPYLLRRTVMIRDVDYEFEDYTLAPGARIKFRFEGTISMQRNINTQIPDKDQAIEWD